MSQDHLHIANLEYRYDSAPDAVFRSLSATFSTGWTGIVGPNGIGKTTLLRLVASELSPTLGSISQPGECLYLEQRTDNPPVELQSFLWSWDSGAPQLRDRLAIGDDYLERWPTLSHGERKRAQIAVALWTMPAVLAVDEPTNHLDADARALVAQALSDFRGVGLIVSHDRGLLDSICNRCLFLTEYGATMRPGGVTQGLEQEERELGHQRAEYAGARAELSRLRREADRRSRAAAGADKKKSKRFIDPKDTAAKFQMDVNRVSGKDAVAGKLLRQLDGRLKQAEDKLSDGAPPPERKLGVTMKGQVARSRHVYTSAAGTMTKGSWHLWFPRLEIGPTDRVALVGPNGAGKSSMLEHIVSSQDPESVVYLPQEISAAAATKLVAGIRKKPNDELGELLSAVSRLGSDPEALLSTETPSPGETRKLLLAEGLSRTPTLIVLDEPTNHMDLPSIRCLEEALWETVCALLVVSHDEVFLSHLTSTRWRIKATDRTDRFDLTIS